MSTTNRYASLVRGDDGLEVRRFPTPEAASEASAAREHTATPDLSEVELRFASKIAAYLASLFGSRQTETDQIYTREEAIIYTKCGNVRTFERWKKEFHVRPLSRDRYSKRALDGGIKDEIRAGTRRRAQSAPTEPKAA